MSVGIFFAGFFLGVIFIWIAHPLWDAVYNSPRLEHAWDIAADVVSVFVLAFDIVCAWYSYHTSGYELAIIYAVLAALLAMATVFRHAY